MAFYVEKYRNIEKREFEVEVVTPLFLGGADPKEAELRAPSIKGALRFWWRAIYGSDDLEEMKKNEAAIFGSTSQKASFSLHLKNTDNAKPVLDGLPRGEMLTTRSKGNKFKISIIEYLAYGLCKYDRNQKRNIYIRSYIRTGTKFKMILIIKDQSATDQIMASLGMLAHHGGIGSRSRNGFGSIKITGTSDPLKIQGQTKSFTALSAKSFLFDKFKPRDRWEGALSEIGKAYREARKNLENKHSFQKRQLIAKPLIVKDEVNIHGRHSKPYFLHVNKIQNNKYQGQILFIPYNYHDTSKRKEYFETCEKMNQVLTQLSGGAK